MSDHAGLEAHYQATKDQAGDWIRPSIEDLIKMHDCGLDGWDESAADNAYGQLYMIARAALDDLRALRSRKNE